MKGIRSRSIAFRFIYHFQRVHEIIRPILGQPRQQILFDAACTTPITEHAKRLRSITCLPPAFAYLRHERNVIFSWLQDQFARLFVLAAQQCHSNVMRRHGGMITEALQSVIIDKAAFFEARQRAFDCLIIGGDLSQCNPESIALQLTQFQGLCFEWKIAHVDVRQTCSCPNDVGRVSTADTRPLCGATALIFRTGIGECRCVRTTHRLGQCCHRLHCVDVVLVQQEVGVLMRPQPFWTAIFWWIQECDMTRCPFYVCIKSNNLPLPICLKHLMNLRLSFSTVELDRPVNIVLIALWIVVRWILSISVTSIWKIQSFFIEILPPSDYFNCFLPKPPRFPRRWTAEIFLRTSPL